MNHSAMESIVRNMEDSCKLSNTKQQNMKSSSSPNNNDEDYDRNLTGSPAGSGSGHESAFSSAASSHEEDCSQLSDLTIDDQSSSPSSGRSSANRESIEDVKLLNPHSNIVPEMTEIIAVVDDIRVKFLSTLKDEDGDLYESSDIDELLKPLPAPCNQEQSLAFRLISRYVNFKQILVKNSEEFTQSEVEAAVESLQGLLKFRHQYQLTTTLPEHFSKEFYLLNGIFQFGHDKQNIPVLYIRARVHRKWSPKFDETFRRYVAWHMNQITKSYKTDNLLAKTVGYNGLERDGSFGLCFDCLHVSYSCLDMEFLKFLVSILLNYYPHYCRYALCVDLPWLFRSVWKLVRTWLPEDAQNRVQLITAKQMTDYIDEDQIPNSFKINDKSASEKPLSGKHQFPKNYDSIKDIDVLGKELGLGSSEIKQFKSHTEKVKKEYEQLGAI